MISSSLLTKVLPRLARIPDGSGVSFIDALNIVCDVFFERLHRRRSEVARVRFTGQDASDEIITLPLNFRGLADPKIYLVSATGARTPLTESLYDEDLDMTGTPSFFKLVGVRQMQILPAPTAVYDLDGWYYAHPGTLSMNSSVPWGGLFDTLIGDAVVMVCSSPPGMGATESIRESVGAMLEEVLTGRTVTPRRNAICL